MHQPDRIVTAMLLVRAGPHGDSLAKHAADVVKNPFLPECLIPSSETCQLVLLGLHRLSRAALGFVMSRLAPAIQHLVRNSKLLGHGRPDFRMSRTA